MPRNARLAVLFAFTLHGILILTARYRLSYDAYNHMFFGDHYRMDWWSLWEPRWYTGFSVASYPPLVHQFIGLLSHLIGIDVAFAVVLWVVLTTLPLAVYSFARIFVGKLSASYSALGAAFLPSMYLTAHVFGQLPTLAATVTALFSMAALNQYLRKGDKLNGLLTVSLLSTVMAFHHATLLLLPWLVLAVVSRLLLTKTVTWHILTSRLLFISLFAALAMIVVIWPFWQWGQTQSMQTPIDHASRHNFFKDPLAPLMFFLPIYGPLVILIPSVVFLARYRRLLGLGFGFFALFLLGLGGTTPLPRVFFGKGWEWLTYDRFAFWASLMFLPFVGVNIILLRRKKAKGIETKIFLPLAAASLLVGCLTVFLPLQPGTVDMRQIVDFLKQDGNSQWRYLTFGFGDQLALLSTLTTATTIDGSYHTARILPELRASGLGQIDTAFWLPDGLSKLDPILQKAGDHGVRWGFVNVSKYVPVLERHGWTKIRTLRGGVQVWENPEAILPHPGQASPSDSLASFSWGVLPMLSLVTSLSLGSLRVWPVQAERILRSVYTFTVALIPISLGHWYYTTIKEIPHDRIYFTYTDALFFLSDALTLLAVILWFSTKIARPHLPLTNYQLRTHQPVLKSLPQGLLLLMLLSILWSRDWRVSLYISLHVLLIILFALSLRDWHEIWRVMLFGFSAALSMQIITGIVGFFSQSTAFLAPLHLKWPGLLDPSVRGAGIVQLPNGEAFLRAYGTLPHPNILGGLAFVTLLGPIALFLRKEKPNNLALLLLIPGISLLALTFSRSAWLALVVFCVTLLWKSRYFDRQRLVLLLVVIVVSFAATLFPFRELVQARTINTTSHAEEFSLIGRAWLNGEAVRMFRENPLMGVGTGSFIIELARKAGQGYVIEPAHNLLLLAGAELGIPGLLFILAFSALFAYRLFRTRHPNTVLVGATLAGLGIISLFDHYLWTLAPGRVMLGLVIGLFIGQDNAYET